MYRKHFTPVLSINISFYKLASKIDIALTFVTLLSLYCDIYSIHKVVEEQLDFMLEKKGHFGNSIYKNA